MTGPVLHCDFETRATADLKKVGIALYARHPQTDVWCMAWAIDDEPVQVWYPGQRLPGRVAYHVANFGTVCAHNAAFEWHIWQFVCRTRYNFPPLSYKQLDCTAARAAVMGLPRDLAGLARDGLKMPVEKDDAGRRLMLQMMKPRKTFGMDDGVSAYRGDPLLYTINEVGDKDCNYYVHEWWADEDRIERLSAYCAQDVVVERAADKRLRPLTPSHRKTWLMDFELNYIRGVQIDMDLVLKAQAVVDVSIKQYDKDLKALTRGAVSGVTKVKDLTTWVRSRGVEIEGLGKDLVVEYLKLDLPDDVRQALTLRQEAGKSSLGKLPTIVNRTNADGRTHDLLLFNGAGPGRWSGKGIQLHNLPRPSLKKGDVAYVIDVLKSDRTAQAKADVLQLLYGSAPQAVSDSIRGMVIAAPGKTLFVRDFANIEGRCMARIAGEDWKLTAFADFDAGHGPDLYKVAIARIMGVRVEDVDDFLRQIGKVAELSLQYEGGVNAFVTMAKNYGVKIGEYFGVITSSADPDLVSRAEWGWEKYGHKMGLDERSWIAAEVVKLAWRAKHPAIVALWKGLVEAAVSAMRDRGTVYHYRDVAYQRGRIGGVTYLICKLPSGRLLYYPHAKLEVKKTSWGAERETVTYWGVDSVTRKWTQSSLYGGLAGENVCQADAYDFLVEAMHRTNEAGYPPVLSVHDENIAERSGGDENEYHRLMAERPWWAPDMPLAVEGFMSERYRK